MQLEAISPCPITCYLWEETNTHLTTTSFQVAAESNKVPPSASSSPDWTAPVPSATIHKTCALDPSPALSPCFEHVPTTQCLSCSEGPKTECSIRGAASPVPSTGARSLPYSCWPHYSWYKPGCRWPSWPPGHTATSCSAGCPPTPPGPFLLGSFPATPPQTCSVAWGCGDPSAGPGIWPFWTSCSWPRPINPVCPDPSTEPSYPQADWHSHPAPKSGA